MQPPPKRKQGIQTARGSDSSRENGAEVELCVSEHQKGGSSAGGVGKMLATVVEEEVGDYG